MTETEYNTGLTILEKNFEMEKKKLMWDYGISQVIFKTGDIIRDASFALQVDRIIVAKPFGYQLPVPVYQGFELKKDLTPRKDKNRVSIYGNQAELVLSAGEKI